MLPSEAAANAVKAATEASARLDAALKEAKDTFAEYPHTLIGKVIRYTLVSDINASPKNKRRRASKKKNIPININTNINSYGNGSYTDALVVGCRIEEDTVWYKVFVIDASRTIDKNGDASTQVIRLDSEYTAEWTLLLDRNGNGNSNSNWPEAYICGKDECIVPMGQRLVVCWEGEYTSKKGKAAQKATKAQKIPYEAFVVRRALKGKTGKSAKSKPQYEYKILYTEAEQYEWRDMEKEDVDCTNVLPYATNFNSLPIVSWSNYDSVTTIPKGKANNGGKVPTPEIISSSSINFGKNETDEEVLDQSEAIEK